MHKISKKRLYLHDLLELTKASKESNLNLIAPELPEWPPLYIVSIEKPNKEEQVLAKKCNSK